MPNFCWLCWCAARNSNLESYLIYHIPYWLDFVQQLCHDLFLGDFHKKSETQALLHSVRFKGFLSKKIFFMSKAINIGQFIIKIIISNHNMWGVCLATLGVYFTQIIRTCGQFRNVVDVKRYRLVCQIFIFDQILTYVAYLLN